MEFCPAVVPCLLRAPAWSGCSVLPEYVLAPACWPVADVRHCCADLGSWKFFPLKKFFGLKELLSFLLLVQSFPECKHLLIGGRRPVKLENLPGKPVCRNQLQGHLHNLLRRTSNPFRYRLLCRLGSSPCCSSGHSNMSCCRSCCNNKV